MKVALVILHADPSRGGAERYTMDLAAALAKRGHSVALLASSFAADIPGVASVRLPARGLTRAGRYRGFLKSLDAHLNHTPYDIVHAMLPVRRCDLYHPHAGLAIAAAQKPNAPFNPRRRLMAAVEHDLLTGPRPPVVIALSDYVKGSIRAGYPNLPDDRLAKLFNAVDLDRFAPTAPDPTRVTERRKLFLALYDQPIGLMIAQDFERKGLREAILALSKLPQSPPLLVVGKQPPGKYRALADELKLPIRFVGPTDDPRRFYALADFFILPTKHDPCSLVVLEALAMGLPVISTANNGACEIMTNGVHGWILPDPADIDALASAIGQLLDPNRRRKMAEACLDLRLSLSYEHHLDQLLAIYARACGSSRT